MSMLSQQVAAAKPPTRAKSNQNLAGAAADSANSMATGGAGGNGGSTGATSAAKPISTPISIGGAKGAAKAKTDAEVEGKKKAPQMAFSMPNMHRPPPPKAPTQRPRVPSCDPPPMALPPSPLNETPIMGTPAIPTPSNSATNVSAPVAVGASNAEKNKPKEKRSITISRSLTIYSSSAPNVSFLPNPALFHPSFAPVTEGKDKPASNTAAVVPGPNSATSVNSATSSTSSTAASSPTPAPGGASVSGAAALGAGPRRKSGLAKEDELLAAVGSPTVFSMLRLDADIRRKNSITDGKLPVLGSSLKKTTSPASALTADGKKKLSESKTQKDIDAAKAAAAAAAKGGAIAGSSSAAGVPATSAAAQTANANEDDGNAAGTEPDDLQFPIDDGEGEDAGDGMAGADAVLDDDEAEDPNKPAARDQYSTLFS